MKKVSFPWMTGKLKTFLYLVSAVTGLGLAACSDETESPAIPDENPLAVNVMTKEVSRGLVHGKFLPDAAEIGVSLYTTDGAAYRTGYENLKYIASDTGDAQSWSTTNIPTLSSIEAKLVAYYPWAENTDYTAVPVETATQTDYMYSQWLTGLSNANNEAYITMDHALTAVRLSLFNDGFSAEAEVTALGIKSEALGTSATLDASTGKLTGIQGLGTEFTVPADFSLTAQPTDSEILMVPDVDKTAGVTTLTATINGKKYAANINFTESYKQGYIYTYTLALKNTSLSVVKVSVTPWQEGTQDAGDLTVDNDYIVKIAVPSDGYTFKHNMYNFTGTIDWGDGTVEDVTSVSSYPSHTYVTAGEYTVTVKGRAEALYNWDNNTNTIRETAYTELIHIGIGMGLKWMDYAFYSSNLNKIHEGALDGCTEVTTFAAAFLGTKINNIPDGLFDKCTKVEYWGYSCYDGVFASCSNLKTIPEGLFKYNTKSLEFWGAFAHCTALESIPGNLFEGCVNATNFANLFYECEKLKSIPVELFDNNSKVTNFAETFAYCTALTGESPYTIIKADGNDVKVHLYERTNYSEHFAAPTSYASCFYNCTGLTDYANIPSAWKGE